MRIRNKRDTKTFMSVSCQCVPWAAAARSSLASLEPGPGTWSWLYVLGWSFSMWPASVDVPLDVLCANSWPHGCRVPFLVTSTTQRTFFPCTAGENSCMACHTQDDLCCFPLLGCTIVTTAVVWGADPVLLRRPKADWFPVVVAWSPAGASFPLCSRSGAPSSRGMPLLARPSPSVVVCIGAHSCLLVILCWNIQYSCCTVLLARGRTVEDRNPLYFVSVASSGRPTLLWIS